MFCPACGRESRPGSSFCDVCGRPVAPGAPAGGPGCETGGADWQAGAAPPPSEADVVCFVGEKSGFYLGKFRKFRVGRVEAFAPTWNWSAFLFGMWWFLYRKMYLWALLAFVLWCIPIVGLAARIATGLAGNYVYWRHLSGQVARARAVTPEAELPGTLSAMGGVHGWVIWVGIALTILALIGIAAAVSIPMFLKAIGEGTRAI
jgi:hypothetical protein